MLKVNGWTIIECTVVKGQLVATKHGFRSVIAPKADLLKLIELLPAHEAMERNELVNRMNRVFDK